MNRKEFYLKLLALLMGITLIFTLVNLETKNDSLYEANVELKELHNESIKINNDMKNANIDMIENISTLQETQDKLSTDIKILKEKLIKSEKNNKTLKDENDGLLLEKDEIQKDLDKKERELSAKRKANEAEKERRLLASNKANEAEKERELSARNKNKSNAARVTVASTAPVSNTVSRGRSSVKTINMMATAYTPFCNGCSGITATGIDVRNTQPNIIAVDPSVIPLGTKVEILLDGTSIGYYIAADTGGAIKGYKIDILVSSNEEAYSFGNKAVTVRILN